MSALRAGPSSGQLSRPQTQHARPAPDPCALRTRGHTRAIWAGRPLRLCRPRRHLSARQPLARRDLVALAELVAGGHALHESSRQVPPRRVHVLRTRLPRVTCDGNVDSFSFSLVRSHTHTAHLHDAHSHHLLFRKDNYMQNYPGCVYFICQMPVHSTQQ